MVNTITIQMQSRKIGMFAIKSVLEGHRKNLQFLPSLLRSFDITWTDLNQLLALNVLYQL